MTLRNILTNNLPYFKINREERNLAAIFYHVLLVNNNLAKFLVKIGVDFPISPEEMAIYFEYAHLRDIWYSFDKEDNKLKRNTILQLLGPSNKDFLETCSILKFNSFFGAVPVPSADSIQSPGNWSIDRFKNNLTGNNEFLKVCKFKWCFNAKPDIVIHTSNEQAICIEAKYESGEGSYPSKASEKDEFYRRGLNFVGQTEIQKMIMELLGVECKFIFLIQKGSESPTHSALLWKDAFAELDLTGCPEFILEWIKRL